MRFKHYIFHTLFLLLITQGNYAQTSKRILLVPFDRLQLHSDFAFSEIAEINQWDSAGVFQQIRQTFIAHLPDTQDKLIYIQLPDNEYYGLHNRLPKVYKKEPIDHDGVRIDPLLQNSQLEQLLDAYAADYILFINKFSIVGRVLMGGRSYGDGSKTLPWSAYKIAYEVYDEEGNMITLDDGFIIKPKGPSNETYLSKGLLTSLIEDRYMQLTTSIWDNIQKYKGRIVYRGRGIK